MCVVNTPTKNNPSDVSHEDVKTMRSAGIDERHAESIGKVLQRTVASIRTDLAAVISGLAEVKATLGKQVVRLDAMEQRHDDAMGHIDGRFSSAEQRHDDAMGHIDGRFASAEQRHDDAMGHIDERFASAEKLADERHNTAMSGITEAKEAVDKLRTDMGTQFAAAKKDSDDKFAAAKKDSDDKFAAAKKDAKKEHVYSNLRMALFIIIITQVELSELWGLLSRLLT